MAEQPMNWARNVEFGAAELRLPASVEELQEIVASSERVRALGSAHSFNRIADTSGVLVSTTALPPVVEVLPDRSLVRVAAGVRYGDLAQQLDEAGYALRNLASLPHISVAGSCATATHGSGDRNQNLPSAVRALELVSASGDLVRLEAGSADFPGAVVGLGGLGVVTTMELEIIPAFEVRQFVYEDIPAQAVTGSFEEIFGSAYSVSVFTDWRSGAGNRIWQKAQADAPATGGGGAPEWLGGRLADGPRNPVPGMDAIHATQQLRTPGPPHDPVPPSPP